MMNGPRSAILSILEYHESTWGETSLDLHPFLRAVSPCGAISSNLFPKNFSCICRKHSALRGFIALHSGGTIRANNGANLNGAAVEDSICRPIVFSGKNRGAFIKFLSVNLAAIGKKSEC